MGFTCIACRLMFADAAAQREHYHTDFHRFNLKRQATGLPPVSQEKYDEKLHAQVVKQEETRQTNYCSVCKKSFGSAKTLKQHLGSRKHFDRARREGVDPAEGGESLETSADADEEEERTEEQIVEEKLRNAVDMPASECLFCGEQSKSMSRNLEHMGSHHGFYLPFVRYLVDAEELLSYLGQKVGTGNSCIQCSRMYGSLDAVRKHMTMTPHCRMVLEDNLDEYGEHYDFSKGVAEDGEADEDEADAAGEEGAEESATSDSAPSAGPGQAVVLSHGYALQTSDGNQIGHRDLRVYYRQSYRHARTSRAGETIKSIMSQYRRMGALAPIGKNKPKLTKKHEKDAFERSEAMRLKVGVTANNQKHYRPQVMF